MTARTCETCGNEADMLFHGNCRSCQIDSYDFPEWHDEEGDGLDECAMMPDGYCMLAGTEHCEWECPMTYSSIRPTTQDKQP
jgi:hypothetical protein